MLLLGFPLAFSYSVQAYRNKFQRKLATVALVILVLQAVGLVGMIIMAFVGQWQAADWR